MRVASKGGNVSFVSHAPVTDFAGSSSPFFFDFFLSLDSSFFLSESLSCFSSDFLSASLFLSPSPSFFASASFLSSDFESLSFGGVHVASLRSYSLHFLWYSTAFARISRTDLPVSRRLRSVHWKRSATGSATTIFSTSLSAGLYAIIGAPLRDVPRGDITTV